MNKLGFKILGFLLLICLTINTSGQTISGKVFSELSEPLAGTSIWIPHTNIGTVTDNKGNYSITIDTIYNILRYCFVGYECQEVTIDCDTIVNITLEESPTELNEIIINGFFIEKRHNLQGSIIKKNGLFRKPDTLIYGLPDSTFNRIETDRRRMLLDSVDTHKLNDSINFIENIPSVEMDFRKYVIDSLEYPEIALNNGICGRVNVRFTINEESKISDIRILRGIEPVLDKEVVSVLENMPDRIQMEFGKYGKYFNRQVPRKYIVKIKFELIYMK
jgi:TonB family protein